jgi:hypothetical protein
MKVTSMGVSGCSAFQRSTDNFIGSSSLLAFEIHMLTPSPPELAAPGLLEPQAVRARGSTVRQAQKSFVRVEAISFSFEGWVFDGPVVCSWLT